MSGRANQKVEGRDLNRALLCAEVVIGVGIGGLFDGIVFHQVLQWHHMLSHAGYPPTTLHNLEVNTFWDGLFHVGSFVFLMAGLALLWGAGHQRQVDWSARPLLINMFAGFGLFNLVEGSIDHVLLGIHHVNETVPRDQWAAWDIGFLLWGAAMLAPAVWTTLTSQKGRQVTA